MTSITTNWLPKLKQGEDLEQELLGILKTIYPNAHKLQGNEKRADFYLPESKLLIELKYDVKSDETNNFAFECYFHDKPSGILTTQSQIWCVADSTAFYFMALVHLRHFLRKLQQDGKLSLVRGGDDNASKMVVVWKNYFQRKDWVHSFKRHDATISRIALQMFLERFYIPPVDLSTCA